MGYGKGIGLGGWWGREFALPFLLAFRLKTAELEVRFIRL